MTKTLTEATARLEATSAELEELDQFESEWSAGARAKRRQDLVESQLAAADAERAELNRLAREVATGRDRLEVAYEVALPAMQAFVEAAEAVWEERLAYKDAWSKARNAGAHVDTLVPTASARAASERGDVLDLVNRLKRINNVAW